MISKADRNEARKIRHQRIRKKVIGTATKPRLNVFRSSKHIYAQIINDETGTTLVSASTMDKTFGKEKNGANIEAAQFVGNLIATRAIAQGFTHIVFDRGGYLYHGRVAALAEAARSGGLQF
jgi:large subunit ribosomal protein L18